MGFEDRFRLNVLLGEWSQGAVWSAVDGQLQRPVAVTLLSEAADETVRERFVALIDGGVTSLRVMTMARVIDAGLNAGGLAYLVTELHSDAQSLAVRLAEGPAIKVTAATTLVLDLLGAVTRMEMAGLSHGDIEPGNVLLVQLGARLSPRLIGLGLNRAAIREGILELDSQEHLSTLGFMAPEQAHGSPSIATGVDAFSAVALLYSWITGRLPFRGADARKMREAAGKLHVPRVGMVCPDLADTALAAVIDKALSRDRADRYADASILTSKLRAALLQTPEARELDVLVGPRVTEPDASDRVLSDERASGPTPRVAPKLILDKPPGPSEVASRRPSSQSPLAKTKQEPGRDRAAHDEASADTTPMSDPAEIAFEKISGLLMIPEDGPPQRIRPRARSAPFRQIDSGELPLGIAASDDDVTPGVEVDPEEPSSAEPADPQAIDARGDAHAGDVPDVHREEPDVEPAGRTAEGDLPGVDAASAEEAGASREVAAAAPTPGDASVADAVKSADGATPTAEPLASIFDDAFGVEDAAGDAGTPGRHEQRDLARAPASAETPLVDLERAPPAVQQDPIEDYVLPRGSNRWPLIAAGLAAVLLAVVGGVWLAFGGQGEDPVAATEPAGDTREPEPDPNEVAQNVQDDPPAPEELPAGVEEQTVSLTGVPAGATVTVDGVTIEGTELSIVGERHQIEVRAEGFEPWRATVDPTSAASLAVELTALEPQAAEAEPEITEAEPEHAEAEPDTAEADDEAGLTPAQLRRREERRARRRARRQADGTNAGTASGIAPNPY